MNSADKMLFRNLAGCFWHPVLGYGRVSNDDAVGFYNFHAYQVVCTDFSTSQIRQK